MTWSIVARDESGAVGVAVATKFFAVGALCPHARGGVGALGTQALVNPLYGKDGLDLLATGMSPQEVVARLTEADAGRDHRQLHLVDRHGRIAAYTGSLCIGWCGHLLRDGHSLAGNMLAGPDVLGDSAAAYAESRGKAFAERLIRALEAGQAAGGDKRGRQSAALLICTSEDYPFLDLRVDDHEDPLAELRRLYAKSLEHYQPFRACLATRANPAGLYERADMDAELARFRANSGHM